MNILKGLAVVLFCSCTAIFADTPINAWTNLTSGNWEDPKWSLGVRPGPNQQIMLTNQGWKAIAIGPNTAQNFPETLDVSSVILGGYTDSFNSLLLNFAGFAKPFTAGSINVGTNSGITALASVLTVSTNSGPGDISIFSVFNQGEQALVNAHTMTLGNVTNAAAGGGLYNQTNGIINADALSAWNGSAFNQLAGSNTIAGWLSLGGGANSTNTAHYSIANGSLTAELIELQRGDFHQTGGSVTAGLNLGAATYTLSAGTLRLPGITIPDAYYGPQNPGGFMGFDATLLQTGGTNFCNGPLTTYREYGFPGVIVPGFGPGRYVLSNGVLCVSSTVRSWLGNFLQWGGWHTNAGTEVSGATYPNWEIRTGSFTLGGGTLLTPYIAVTLGDFTQSGGTNQVSGDIGVGINNAWSTFTLTGGLLTDLNTSVDASYPATPGTGHAIFSQGGGTHTITNLLRLSGEAPSPYHGPHGTSAYVLTGGSLNAPNIQIINGAIFEHDGGTLLTSGLLTLDSGASWKEKTSGQQLGQLLLSGPAGSNASFSLPSGNCMVRFGNSSSVSWSNPATLFIDNWNGSPAGAGQHQFIFGSDSSSLTPQQLNQIQFRNPAGEVGIFPARLLPTGEIVPDRFLAAHKVSNNLVIEWSSGTLQSATNVAGPYLNVNGATSPYTAPFTEPRQFFRIQQ